MIVVKVTLLDGPTKEYETHAEFCDERRSLAYTLTMIGLLLYIIITMVMLNVKHGIKEISNIEKVISLLGYIIM